MIESIPEECRADVLREADAVADQTFDLVRRAGAHIDDAGKAASEARTAVIARYAALADNAAAAARLDQPESTLKGENDRLRFAVERLTKDNAAMQGAIANAIGALPKSKRLAETFLVNALHVTKGTAQ
jgi:hypothetical protein